MYPRNSKKRRGTTLGDEGKGKKTAARYHSPSNSGTSSGKGEPR